MQICLEGPRGDWDWFDFDIREPNLGLDLEKVKAATGTDDPVVIDAEYDDTGLDDILKYDGMGYTPVSNLFKQAELLQDLDDYDLERVAIYMRTQGGDLEYAVDHYDNHVYIETNDSDPASLAHEWVDISGEIPKEVAERYFDYKQLGQDLLMDGYETDSDDPYEVGENYIDEVYGGLDLYLAEIAEDPRNGNYYNDYFDWDAYGRDLSFSNTYDEQSGVWISESKNKNVRISKLTESIDLTQRFKDPQGMFGEPGSIVTAQELKDYWDEEYEWDPSLQDFDSFEDWYYDTIEWFTPLQESTVKKLHIKESESSKKYTGNTWNDFIANLEANSRYKVDSAYRLKYEQWIELIDDNGVIYDAEVTPIYHGGYELMDYNINKSYSHNESVRKVSKTRIKESAIKNNIENIMYNASLVHNYDDLDVVLSSLYKLDKELYNKYQDIYRTQKIRPKQLADMIYDELSNILGQND
jgi:hypothetical protein